MVAECYSRYHRYYSVHVTCFAFELTGALNSFQPRYTFDFFLAECVSARLMYCESPCYRPDYLSMITLNGSRKGARDSGDSGENKKWKLHDMLNTHHLCVSLAITEILFGDW